MSADIDFGPVDETYIVPWRTIPMPARIAKLRTDKRGFPVPAFVWDDPDTGEPDFRVVDERYMIRCYTLDLCWICGEPLGSRRLRAFVVGPMCVVNGTSAEPPSHLDCGTYAARACPFLTHPKLVRPDDTDLMESGHTKPVGMIDRNPGVAVTYVAAKYEHYRIRGTTLWHFEGPVAVEWWCRGRLATGAECVDSIVTGLPTLVAAANENPDPQSRRLELQHLDRLTAQALALTPDRGTPTLPPEPQTNNGGTK